MDIRLPKSKFKKRASTEPKAGLVETRKSARLRPFPASKPGQCWPGYWLGQPGPILREPEAVSAASPLDLGKPLNIAEVGDLIGCSPWTVRQTLIPKGLPHFRFTASGRLIFYRDQVIRWIEKQQEDFKTS
jgi:hypothetical protein